MRTNALLKLSAYLNLFVPVTQLMETSLYVMNIVTNCLREFNYNYFRDLECDKKIIMSFY